MRQSVQHVLTHVICLAFVAGSIVGCADFGGTVREHPRAATGTAVGAAGGAVAGGLISKGATEFIKSPAGCRVTGRLAGEGLPSSDCDVDRAGIDLHAAAHAFCLLRGDQCRALSEKRVEYNLARGGAVHYRVSDQSHRFDRVARISG